MTVHKKSKLGPSLLAVLHYLAQKAINVPLPSYRY